MSDGPRVVILGINYAPEATGIAPYTAACAEGLAAAGHPVTALVAYPHYPEWRFHDGYGRGTNHDSIGGVGVVRLRHFLPNPPRGLRRLLSELSFGFRLLTQAWGRPAAVIAVSPALFSAWIASSRRGRTPFIVWVQDLYTLGLTETGEGGGLATRITRWVETKTLLAADRVVVIHDRFAEWVVHELGVPAERVVVIRNWTHLPPSQPVDRAVARVKFGWAPDETVVLHAGNQGVKQGLDAVVAAARLADVQAAPVRFVLLGDGGERARLEASATGIERIEFVDPLPTAEFQEALAAADVLLVNEKLGVAEMAVPSKLTSYFDAARPVLAATAEDGITASELRDAEAGDLVPADDSDALLQGVMRLRADPDRAERLGANGRRYRETVLDQSAALHKWVELIAEVVDAAPR